MSDKNSDGQRSLRTVMAVNPPGEWTRSRWNFNKRVLFLDDNPNRWRDFSRRYPSATWVQTAEECIEKLKALPWDVVFLDHDLGGKEMCSSLDNDTGPAVVRWLMTTSQSLHHEPAFVVHSMNPPGHRTMFNGLQSVGASVAGLVFGSPGFWSFVDGLAETPVGSAE